MDPKERKQLAMQKLDQLYTGGDVPFTHVQVEEKKGWKPGLGGVGTFITLGVGTFISLGIVLPELNKALDAGFAGNNDGTVRTVMGLVPLMIAVTTIMAVLGMVTGNSEHTEVEDGSKTKEAAGIGKIKRAIRGKTYPI